MLLAIDNDSIALDPMLDVHDLFSSGGLPDDSSRALQLMAQGWPWNREVYALILDRLIGFAGAKAVVLDCFFAEPGPGDEKFRQALDRYRGHVVVGSNFVIAPDVALTRQTPSRYDLPSSSIIPASDVPDSRIGFTNFFTDENHVIRGAQYQIRYRDGSKSEATYLSLAARAAIDAGQSDRIPMDVSERLIRFAGAPRVGFKPHSIYEIFVPEYWAHNYGSGEKFRDKIVVIGGEGSWQKDELMTPFGMMPGVELHLNALNALLARDFLRPLPVLILIGFIFLAGSAAAALCLAVGSPWTRLTATLVANGLIVAIAVFLYNSAGIWFPVLACTIAWDFTLGLGFLSDLAFERLEKLRLKTTLKARENLTQMIVHDLRSPLTIVRGYVGILQKSVSEKLGEDSAQYLEAALHGTSRMNDMITTLLDVDRFEVGQMPMRFQQCDLGQLIEDTARRFTPVFGRRHFDYDRCAGPVVISCDPDLIRRVIENIFNNAVKYTLPDGRIEISLVREEAHVGISIADDGAGIPVDQRERIFDKFGQIDGGGKHRHSTGLGLTFCRLVVEGHGGRIWVDEPKLGGTTFVFTLPTLRPTPIAPAAKTASAAHQGSLTA